MCLSFSLFCKSSFHLCRQTFHGCSWSGASSISFNPVAYLCTPKALVCTRPLVCGTFRCICRDTAPCYKTWGQRGLGQLLWWLLGQPGNYLHVIQANFCSAFGSTRGCWGPRFGTTVGSPQISTILLPFSSFCFLLFSLDVDRVLPWSTCFHLSSLDVDRIVHGN